MSNEILELMQAINLMRAKLSVAGFRGATLYDQIDQALEENSKLRREIADLRRPQPMRDWG